MICKEGLNEPVTEVSLLSPFVAHLTKNNNISFIVNNYLVDFFYIALFPYAQERFTDFVKKEKIIN